MTTTLIAMTHSQLIDLYFDKGNGALFQVDYDGTLVRCFISQSNEFLAKKAGRGISFVDVFERYIRLIHDAALINIRTHGVSNDTWGNLITEKDIEVAQA